MTTTALITAALEASVSATVTVASGNRAKFWTAGPLTGNEAIDILQVDGSDLNASPIIEDSPQGTPQRLQIRGGRNAVSVNGPGNFRVSKPVTEAAVGVFVDT